MQGAAAHIAMIDQLREAVYRVAVEAATAQCYLLMQVADTVDEAGEDFDEALTAAGIQPVRVRIPGLPEQYWPILIRLQLDKATHSSVSVLAVAMALRDGQLRALRKGQIQRTCAWLFTDLSIDEAAGSVAARSVAFHPHSRRRRWLRYYDPMVADLFWQSCGRETRQHILSGMKSWAYIDRWQGLQVLVSSPSIEATSASVSPQAWARLECVGALNQAWIRMRAEGFMVDPGRFWRCAESVQSAYLSGVRKQMDLDLFAWHALQRGPSFHEHPHIQEVLQQVRDGADYGDLTAGFDEQHWKQIELEAGSALAPSTQERVSP